MKWTECRASRMSQGKGRGVNREGENEWLLPSSHIKPTSVICTPSPHRSIYTQMPTAVPFRTGRPTYREAHTPGHWKGGLQDTWPFSPEKHLWSPSHSSPAGCACGWKVVPCSFAGSVTRKWKAKLSHIGSPIKPPISTIYYWGSGTKMHEWWRHNVFLE